MAYLPHVRMSALGRLGTSGERFSFGVALGKTDDGFLNFGASANADVWDDIAADTANFFSRPATKLASRAVLEEVKFAHIGADGKYLADPYIANIPDASGGFTGVFEAMAGVLPQSALVVSLGSSRRGPRGRGRFYLPMPVVTLGPDLRIDSADRDAIEASAATYVNDVNNQPGLDVLGLGIVVASSFGTNTPVNSVRVGRVVDTVRSRRTSIAEDYGVPTAIAIPGE